MTRIVLLLLLLSPLRSFAQKPTTAPTPPPPPTRSGNAQTKAECSPAVTGDNNNFKFSCGIGEEQGKQIIELLNKMLAADDISVVIQKLNTMQKDISKIKASTAARHLTSDQQTKLQDVAKAYPEQTINLVINWGDTESADYALEFISALKSGKWNFFAGGIGYGQAMYTPPIHGLVFLVNPTDNETHHVPDACVALYNTMTSVTLNPIAAPNPSTPTGQCRLVIGTR